MPLKVVLPCVRITPTYPIVFFSNLLSPPRGTFVFLLSVSYDNIFESNIYLRPFFMYLFLVFFVFCLFYSLSTLSQPHGRKTQEGTNQFLKFTFRKFSSLRKYPCSEVWSSFPPHSILIKYRLVDAPAPILIKRCYIQ